MHISFVWITVQCRKQVLLLLHGEKVSLSFTLQLHPGPPGRGHREDWAYVPLSLGFVCLCWVFLSLVSCVLFHIMLNKPFVLFLVLCVFVSMPVVNCLKCESNSVYLDLNVLIKKKKQ